MKCPRCGGSGKYMREVGGYRPCEHCNGTGEIVQTNEEWFCQLSTKEKAKWLSKQRKFIYDCVRKGRIPKIMYEEDWEYWLKEKHDD